ncbi:MAG: cadherin-like beta sandwich domain-containing protein [Butyrivibrio sp.]
MKKRVFGILLSILMVIALVPSVFSEQVRAASGTGSISVSQGTIISGNNITVSVSLSASATIMVGTFTMYYDTDKFEFVSTDGPAATSSPSGAIPFQYDPNVQSSQMNFSVIFKAKNVGQGNFSIGDINIVVDAESGPEYASISFNTASCTVMAVGSDDATLSSLSVAGASLSPAFAKWTQDYVCYVSNAVTAVNISAVASQGGRVDISGNPGSLNVGSNYVTVTSYAPNGKAMKYNINVYRLEPPTEPPTEAPTEPPTEPAPDVKVTVDGKNFELNSGYPDDIIPEGYTARMVEYKGNEVRAVVNGETGMTLVYLVDGNGDGAFYTYDTSDQSFYRYIVLPADKQTFILANPAKAEDTPAGCKEGKMTIREVADIPVLISEENKEFVYFYAINGKGEKGWYCYDTLEDTFQRVNIPKAAEAETTEAVTETETESETYDFVIGSLNGDIDNLNKENGKLKSTRNIIVASGGVLLAAAIVIIIVMAAHKSEKKNSIDLDTDSLADEEDYIEIEKDDSDVQEDGSGINAEAEFAAAEENADAESTATEENAEAESGEQEENADDNAEVQPDSIDESAENGSSDADGSDEDDLEAELLDDEERFGNNEEDSFL